MQIPILAGIRASDAADLRTSYPRNLVPVPKDNGISKGYLRPADGIAAFATGTGKDRCGILWKDRVYRVSGTQLLALDSDGTPTNIGVIQGDDVAAMDYSSDRLAIVANGALWYYDGAVLAQVTDGDLGSVQDVCFLDGYFVLTDGEFIVVTELNDPTSINPLKYGTAEADPDPIMRVLRVRNELTAVGRYSVEVFENVGGDNFPFQRIPGAYVSRGAIGRRAACVFEDAVAFLGGGRTDNGSAPPSIYVSSNGASASISTQEIDTILREYTEAQLATAVLEPMIDRQHQRLLVHLPDQTLVYDAAASRVLQEPVWYTLDSGLLERQQYRARHHVWGFDRWITGDPSSASIGALTNASSDHFGAVIGWDFGVLMLYNPDGAAIVHELELIGLPGRCAFGAEPTIWTSYSIDGETWSQELPIRAGRQGQRNQRMVWRRQGMWHLYRTQRFRGTSDAFLSFARLEAKVEALGG